MEFTFLNLLENIYTLLGFSSKTSVLRGQLLPLNNSVISSHGKVLSYTFTIFKPIWICFAFLLCQTLSANILSHAMEIRSDLPKSAKRRVPV